MPYSSLQVRPGFNTNVTQTQNKNGWSFCNLVRWKSGLLEKLGGWERLFSSTIAGIARALHAYEDLLLNNTLLLGTDGGAQAFIDDTLYSFSFVRRAPDVGVISATPTATSVSVLVHDVANGASAGDTILFPITTAIGGKLITGGTRFTIASIVDANNWRFNLPVAATTNDVGTLPIFVQVAGSTTITCTLPVHGLSTGNSFVVQQDTLTGFPLYTVVPAGTYIVTVNTADVFTFTVPAALPATDPRAGLNAFEGNAPLAVLPLLEYLTTSPSSVSNWFIDNLGNNGLFSYTNSAIYVYTPPITSSPTLKNAGTNTSPQINAGMFVAMPQAQVIAFGSEGTIGTLDQDPLLVRWTDPGSYSIWVASSTNQAGSYRLSRGSKIVGGIQAPQTTLLWTDLDLWSMSYVGFPLVYGFNILASGCGLVSPKARAILGGTCYWMGLKNFWMLGPSGAVALECPVWDQIFPLIDQDNINKIHAGANSSFQEIFFFYPPADGDGEPTSYVKLKVEGGQILWDYGTTLPRSTWLDESVFGTALGADPSTLRIQQHEIGYDDDGEPMTGVFAESGYADMGDGTYMMFYDQAIPDMTWAGDLDKAAVDMSLKATNFPGVDPQTNGPLSVTNTTRLLPFRARCRQIAVRFEWAERTGYNARVGLPRFRSAPAGRL